MKNIETPRLRFKKNWFANTRTHFQDAAQFHVIFNRAAVTASKFDPFCHIFENFLILFDWLYSRIGLAMVQRKRTAGACRLLIIGEIDRTAGNGSNILPEESVIKIDRLLKITQEWSRLTEIDCNRLRLTRLIKKRGRGKLAVASEFEYQGQYAAIKLLYISSKRARMIRTRSINVGSKYAFVSILA